MNYNVELKINGFDYSEYVQLPFSITETLDETMDTGAMTLNFMAERTPFKPYSECEITLTQPDNVPKKYTMLLESDKVEEIQHGNGSYWKHNLTFIETTYLLSNYYLPDFAITQPITAFAFPKAVPTITEGSFDETLFGFGWRVGRLGYTDKFVLSDTSYSIKTKYISPLNLSNTVTRNWAVNFITSAGAQYGSITEVYDSGAISYTYYYKLHSGSTWTQITDISNISLAEGLYDIKAVMNTNFTYHYKYTSSSPSAYTINWEDRTANASSITGLSETVLFENIEVAAAATEADIYTIKEGIEKVLGVAKLEEIGEDYDFITLSAEAITKYNLDNLKCPEMTITNGKNMLEVLYELGKEFNAYPRLIKDNGYKLTFDVLENPRDNSTYEDGDELETEESNMTNYANVLVSNVANMTSSETTKIYPGINRWISCRADPNDITLKKENMSILVDDNINYLVKVKVKNWKTADLSDEQDITGYIFEKTVYDSLNKNANGQGLALYYEKGKNKIVGLGYLPQIQSYISLGPTEYIIQRILTEITSVAKEQQKDPLNFLYQVEYVPYINARVITHQANNADFDSDYQANYNQATANINAEAFGKDTQKTISRIGNNNVNNLARVESISQIPYAGEHKQIYGVDYFANVVTTTFNNNSITVALEYSKDYNKINNRVGIDKEYREYSLYADSFVNRTVNIDDFCEVSISDEDTPPTEQSEQLRKVAGLYKDTIDSSVRYVGFDAFKMTCYKANGTTRLQYTPFRGTAKNLKRLIIPASLTYKRNALLLVGSCYDNYSVGQYIDGSSYAFGSCANKDARYVDDVGELPVVELTLANAYNLYDSSLADAQAFPIGNDDEDIPGYTIGSYLFYRRKFRVNKDNRERLIFAYGLHFYTKDKSISIHQGANKYMFHNESITPEIMERETILVGFNGDVKNKDIINYTTNDILNTHAQMTFGKYNTNNSYCLITTTAVTPSKDYNGFALIWNDTGEILYSFKQPLTAGVEMPSKYIYFNFLNKKI
jgi:hypothetical protein